jgi:hypothetical protein
MTSLRTFLTVFAAQFVAFAVGDSLSGNPVAWKVMSVPLIPVVGWFAENWIWLMMIGNGFLWTALLIVLLHRLIPRAATP